MPNYPELKIRDSINRKGKITFAEFMQLALYHRNGGYYTGALGIGASGDYFTSPTAHPVFAALITMQLHRMWEILGEPTIFYVVEMGAGTGILGREVVSYAGELPNSFSGALRYVTLERRAVIDIETNKHDNLLQVLSSVHSMPLKNIVGCFISNELMDCFPVHRFKIRQGSILEIYVTLDKQSEFIEVFGEPSTPLMIDHLKDLIAILPEGFTGEIRLNIKPWVEQISGALDKGFVVTIDYGYETKDMCYQNRFDGTLQTYHQHMQGSNPYRYIGSQDITADVDFSRLELEGELVGLRSLELLSQSDFLKSLGFEQMRYRLLKKMLTQKCHDANMMAMLELIKRDGLGRFKVLIQEYDTGVSDIKQLVPRTALRNKVDVPLLSSKYMSLMEGKYSHLADYTEGLWPFE